MKRLASMVVVLQFLSAPSPAQSGPAIHGENVGNTAQDHALEGHGLSQSDFASIHAAIDAHRHAVSDSLDGFAARNPGQQWSLRFDGRAFLVDPDRGDWAWGLELLSYGRTGAERSVARPARAYTESTRVSYEWDSSLTEWYLNDRRGLEHGYTLLERPAGADAEIQFTLAVRGDLQPRLGSDGRSISFVDAGERSVLDYGGLTVFDADGVTLPARFVLPTQPNSGGSTSSSTSGAAATLALVIDDEGARYPLTIDPVAQEAYIKSSNSQFGDGFSFALATSGDTLVVGAFSEDSAATGVNGNQADQSGGTSGAAYVFVRSGGIWTQQAYLKASNTGVGDQFGTAVDIDGDTIVVGAWAEDSNATGVDGNGANNSLTDSGAAYVFTRTGTTWSQQAYLKSPAGGFDDSFGLSVGVSGDTVVVGAHQEDSNATGINGNFTNNSSFNAGAAYVFARSGTTWTHQAYLKASNTSPNDQFGRSVGVSGDTIVIGAYQEDSNSTGANGDQVNNLASASGAAYVFLRSGTTWSQQAYLKASNTGAEDQFGYSVSAEGDSIVVGAFSEDSSATGVNGNQADNGALHSGAAYVFTRSGTVWSQQAYLKASNSEGGDSFGWSVDISGDRIVVGASQESSQATGVDGNQSDNSQHWAGAAYVFDRSLGLWGQTAYLKASNTEDGDQFGWDVAVAGDMVVVGAPFEDSQAVGIGGFQGNDPFLGIQSGAAYAFAIGSGQFIDLGNGLAGSTSPLLTGSGSLASGGNFSLTMTALPAATTAYLIVGNATLFAPFMGGILVPTIDLVIPLPTGSGTVVIPATTPPGIPSGVSIYVQAWIPDAGGPVGLSATNALQCKFP